MNTKMKLIYFLLLSVVALSSAASIDNTNILEKLSTFDEINDEYINILNSAQDSWTAGHNFPPGTKFADLNVLTGAKPKKAATIKTVEITDDVKIPKSFDAREHWPKCQSISHIRNQGHCGSCWAVSSESTMSDRLCISTNGKFNTELASQRIVSCTEFGTGCNGGWPSTAWNYFINDGLPTGGDYHSNQGCQPYLVEPCINRTGSDGHPKQCPRTPYVKTPACHKTCYNSKYHKSLKQDLHFGKSTYSVLSNVSAIQKEIMTHGPVVTCFTVYCDFYAYKKGVYEPNTSETCSRHAVRIIGWGVENGKDYWLITNQWGKEWGDNGLVKFRRGTNVCGIEEDITAGIALK